MQLPLPLTPLCPLPLPQCHVPFRIGLLMSLRLALIELLIVIVIVIVIVVVVAVVVQFPPSVNLAV